MRLPFICFLSFLLNFFRSGFFQKKKIVKKLDLRKFKKNDKNY